jgi:hypothetical protein
MSLNHLGIPECKEMVKLKEWEYVKGHRGDSKINPNGKIWSLKKLIQ